jgi:uroporphyrinogen-III decarboxylase
MKIMINDGIYSLLPENLMIEPAVKLRNTYAIKPGAPIYKREFGYYCLDKWKKQGMPQNIPHEQLFDYDDPGNSELMNLGWCEANFSPEFETKVLEDRGKYELVQDFAGRKLLCFKGRRNGFMPEYLDHPVKDMKTWKENVKWRLNPKSQKRLQSINNDIQKARIAAGKGLMITQKLVGGYMYLRSLIGPLELLYKFYEEPELIHDCMQSWFELADAVISENQKHITLDELFLAEDICYNKGSLISPKMIREFLFPYYKQLIKNIKQRQLDLNRHLYIQIDTDGFAVPLIPVYQEIGMDVMSPFEVASGCDVVQVAKDFPELVITGGIDKRILAESKEAVNKELERIIPVMYKRGGYIPTCDHGVPEEVPYENYLYYRKRCVELGG